MKPNVLDIMRFKVLLLLFLSYCAVKAQVKKEQEFRIAKNDFPQNSLRTLQPHLTNAKRIRFYKEFDGKKTSFESKFKKDRLKYSIEFDSLGQLEDVEFIIKEKDIPEETWLTLQHYLKVNYHNSKIKKIQQQYPIGTKSAFQVLESAFQNLLLPDINYELIISAKEDSGFTFYEVSFDHEGNFLNARKLVDSNYDHVLY